MSVFSDPTSRSQALGALRRFLEAHVMLGVALLAALVLRLHGLTHESLWSDELATVFQSADPPWEDRFWRRIGSDVHPPGYVVFMWMFRTCFGDSEFALRLPAALAGVVSVFVVYLIGHRVYSKAAGLAAALLTAVSPFLILYSQQARAYSMLFALAAAALLAWLDLLRNETSRRVRRRQTVLAAVLSALCAYVHYSGLLFVATAGTLTLIFAGFSARKELPRILAAAGLALLLYAPWAQGLLDDLGRSGLPFLTTPEVTQLSNFPLIGLPPYVFLACAVLAALGHSALPARPVEQPAEATLPINATLFLSSCFIVVVLGFYVKSIVSQPIYNDKYLIVAWPPIFVLLGAAATKAFSMRVPMIALSVVAGLVVLELIYVTDYYNRLPRQDFRRAAQLGVKWIDGKPDVRIVSQGYGKRFDYYLKQFNSPRMTDTASSRTSVILKRVKQQFADNASHVLLLTAHGQAESSLPRLKQRYQFEQHRKLRGINRGTTVTLLRERPQSKQRSKSKRPRKKSAR